MNKSLFAFVFFATGWGPTEGGINAVNFDLCNAMGDISEEKHSDVYCIFSGAEPLDQEKTKASEHNVKLIHVNEEDFKTCKFDAALKQIPIEGYEIIYWVGHDIISGNQALACKDTEKIGKTVLFHHMNYIAYYGLSKSAGVGNQKNREQRTIFSKADYAIAVGPQLSESLKNNLLVDRSSTKCGEVIPGLAEIESLNRAAKNPMTVLFTGRLEKDNDPVKQYSVPLLAVSDLVRENNYTPDNITIKLIGLKGKNTEAQANDFMKQAQKRAGRIVNVQPLEYTASREELFDQIKRSIVTVMPSISEGFGLAGYESIAAGVPTIISKNSGLYKFLSAKNVELEKFVYGIDVTGNENLDVQNVKQSIHSIITYSSESKKRAIELRDKLLELGYTWAKTAEDTYSFLLPEISELSGSLEKMISNEACQFLKENVSDDYVLATAINHANQFAEDFAKKFKVDKQNVLSRSFDKLYSVQNSYNRASYEQIVLGFMQEFLEEIAQTLKNNNAEKEILINFTDDNCEVLKNESDGNVDSFSDDDATELAAKQFKKVLKKGIIRIISKIKRDKVLTQENKAVIKNYHDNLLAIPEYNTIDFQGVAVIVSDDPNQSKAKLKDIYVPIGLKDDDDDGTYQGRDYFESCDQLIIVGDPGSGKSVYLKNKLLEHCRSNSDRICVFIRVAEFSKSIDIVAKSNENSLEKYVATAFKNTPEAGTFKTLKDIGGVDYYIDGLDEVQDSKKKESVNRAIVEFIDKAKGCKFFITSRKIGLDTQLFQAKGFEVKEIAPLSKRSIEEYVDKWYDFIKTTDKKDYKERKRELKEAIVQDKALLTLASNPLLLSIIAILHYHGKKLPNNKASLYKTITETLLLTWIEHKNLTVLKDLQNLDNQDLTNVFSRAAHWMIENKYGEMTMSESRLGAIYEDYCNEKKKGIKIPTKNKLLRYISEDAGIVVDGGVEDKERIYKFLMHRQFAEYYAAMALNHKLSTNDKELVDNLTKILSEPKWTEVSILMCDHLHAFDESGDAKVQKCITELLKIKSNPIEDFYTNIQLILKWVINGVVLNEEIMQQLFACLDKIFHSKNRFRAIQFSDDIVKAFADTNNTWYQEEFCDFIKCLIDSDEYAAKRNAAVILDLLLHDEKSYKKILKNIGEERLIKALKPIVENEDFYMLVGSDACYKNLFEKKYIACVNQYFDSASDENKNIWVDFTAVYAFERKNFAMEKNIKIEKLLQCEAKLFKHDNIRDEFVHSVIFWSIAINIATSSSKNDIAKWGIDIDRWGCRSMIDSAVSIKNDDEIGTLCTNYSDSDIRLYHKKNKDEKKHIFTIFCYNREEKTVEKHQLALPYKFSLEDLRRQIKKENISSYLNEYTYLRQLKEPEMTKEELKKLFDQSYDGRRILTGEAWHQLVIDKIAEDGKVFYEHFDEIKRTIGTYDRLDISDLKSEAQIYFRHLFSRRKYLWARLFDDFDDTHKGDAIKSVGFEDKQLIIELYNNTEIEEHKAVLYEILYNLRNIE